MASVKVTLWGWTMPKRHPCALAQQAHARATYYAFQSGLLDTAEPGPDRLFIAAEEVGASLSMSGRGWNARDNRHFKQVN